MMPLITRELPSLIYLQDCFAYQASTGRLIWRDRPVEHFGSPISHRGWRRFIGRHAGHLRSGGRSGGYWTIRINNRPYYAHRIIFKLLRGGEPPEIDHIDGDRSNNRIENLRAVDHAQNCWTSKLRARSLPRGVYPAHGSSGWIAQIKCRGDVYHLGTFPTPDLAGAAYLEAASRLRRLDA